MQLSDDAGAQDETVELVCTRTEWEDVEVQCDKSATISAPSEIEVRGAEFEVEPGITAVMVCFDYRSASDFPIPPPDGPLCQRTKAQWTSGTTIGFVGCGDSSGLEDSTVTVHRRVEVTAPCCTDGACEQECIPVNPAG